ncbi:unnamed protein product, partial [Polarella glacialis]
SSTEKSRVFVRKWQVLGPFVVGKNELDGEPWLTSNASELVEGGLAKTERFSADAQGTVAVGWNNVDWQSLVNSIGGHELLEWQALARGSFKLPQ